MIISLIVAASENNVIGKDNKLLWHLPNDMKFFKNTTWAMPVIMGRKTYEAMANEPLPGRFNFVVSRKKDWKPTNEKAVVTTSVQQAIDKATETDCKEIFIIGGGQIYSESMAIADKIYMTRVHTIVEGDTYFPEIDAVEWQCVSNVDCSVDDKHSFAYSFQVWVKKI